jgi:SHS2 domain-containing protein
MAAVGGAEGFKYLDHMTDAVIEAYGTNLEAAFENSARGLVNVMFDISKVFSQKEIMIEAHGYDLQSLLYDWLEKVMLVILTENVVLSDFKVKISNTKLEESNAENSYFLLAYAKGESINLEKHHYKVEIKGVTYHEMQILQPIDKNEVTIRFLLDL